MINLKYFTYVALGLLTILRIRSMLDLMPMSYEDEYSLHQTILISLLVSGIVLFLYACSNSNCLSDTNFTFFMATAFIGCIGAFTDMNNLDNNVVGSSAFGSNIIIFMLIMANVGFFYMLDRGNSVKSIY